MRKPSNRVWVELKKELGRFSNLVWVAALLCWLVLSSSRYSHWHSLSHHLLHKTWLFGAPNTLHIRHSHSHSSFSHLSNASTPWVLLHHPNGTFTDSDQEEKFHGSEDGINLPTLYSHDDLDDEEDANYTQASHQAAGMASDHTSQALQSQRDEFYENPTLDNSTWYAHTSDLEANASISSQALNEDVQGEQASASPEKTCATVEEMGLLAASTSADASLRVRKLIRDYFSQHGASRVRELPAEEFCHRGFVFGRAAEDGLGNDIYKILTASGLSIMLNRSLIIAEHGYIGSLMIVCSCGPTYPLVYANGHVRPPFGDYLRYSDETFYLNEVKRLWVKHDCAGVYKRPLTMVVDDFQRPTRTKVFCEDWLKWKHPIIWFKGTTDSNALQFFLKNQHHDMREAALSLFGNPSQPSSRPNVFGELFRAFISPMPAIEEAVDWVLQGRPDPDVSVHMRMLNSRSRAASYAVSNCIGRVLKSLSQNNSLPQIVIVSDTPLVVDLIKEQLEGFAQVINFDYKLFMNTRQNLSKVMTGNSFQPPEKRVKDWGSMPRWVAIVDMFLAARAKIAVISGANRRVGTTYAQLLASLAAATTIDERTASPSLFKFYSSFQTSLVAEGLAGQRGWGHTWRRFAGYLSCKNQKTQCAQTPLLPYAWWDGPWQSPAPRDIQKMLAYGIKLSESGQVEEGEISKTCMSRKAPLETVQLMLPSCKRLKVCHQ